MSARGYAGAAVMFACFGVALVLGAAAIALDRVRQR